MTCLNGRMVMNSFFKVLALLVLTFPSFNYANDHLALGVSQEIAQELEQKGMAVIFGAPGSGKTEQMRLALQDKTTDVFDLRKEFLSAFKEFSKTDYNTIPCKEKQAIWFEEQKDAFLDRFLSSNADVIVFDEIDLSISKELNDDELLVALEIVQMAKDLHASGSQVIIIIHTSALQNTVFWEAMGSHEVVETRYLTDAEEDFLLEITPLTFEEKQNYKQLAQGLPAAYLTLMDMVFENKKALYTYDELVSDTKQRILKNIAVIKSMEPELFQAFVDLTNSWVWKEIIADRTSWEDLDPIQDLIYTGLIGVKNGKPVFSQLVRTSAK